MIAGSLIPRGRAVPIDGGYRVSGRWAFASGVQHYTWAVAACFVAGAEGSAQPAAGVSPEMRVLFVPVSEIEVIDTWSVGDCYDTAMAESFFATLKCELVARSRWRTHAEARMAVFDFIEGFYNPRRRHSALAYLGPAEYERRHHDPTAA